MKQSFFKNFALCVAAGSSTIASGAPASAATPLEHVRGSIVASSPSGIDIRTATGVVHVVVAAKTKYVAVLPSSRAAIKTNTFVGIASTGDAPGARAREVVVFPDAMRGTGEGHYGWDLPGGGNKMTNGTVTAPKSMMTNGTVSSAMHADGPMTINVAYKGGSNRITVPANAPIVTFAPGAASIVKAGAHAIVFAQPTGKTLTAAIVLVGKDGLTPPM